MIKPMLACDAVESKIRFPALIQPKIDGVRCLNLAGALTGRSLNAHKNIYLGYRFGGSEFVGLDGEMAAGHECDSDLCRSTTSALNTILGKPYTNWHLFDFVTEDTVALPYHDRFARLCACVERLRAQGHDRLRVVPTIRVRNLEELLAREEAWLSSGYEGTIIRDPLAIHKNGRSTVRAGELLRLKRFIEGEAVVLFLTEGETNCNVATVNNLGLTERSSHQANMVRNGMIGSMECQLLKTVEYRGQVLFRGGQIITVAAGCMTHDERTLWFRNTSLIIGKVIKFKTFPKGVKDKPRFPTFQSIRAASDM